MDTQTNQVKEISPSIKVIFRYEEKVMLIRLGNGTYDIPGGRVEYGQSNAETLRRELEEEIGFQEFDENRMKLFHSWHYVSQSKNRHYVYVVYLYDLDVLPSFQHKEVSGIVWMTKNEVSQMSHIPEFRDMSLRAFDF